MSSKARRRIPLFPKVAGLALFTAVLAGVGYERVGERRDRKRVPRIGRAIDIGGRSLNISCSGAGDPPVILDAPGDSPGYIWVQTRIHPEIAKFTRACWYDRAGEGWSDPGPFPRTSAAISKDLHELLLRARIPPPYVLVGYSFGGLNVRVFNRFYPDEVAGMVLVESAHEGEPERAPRFYLAPSLPRFLWYPVHLLLQASARTGLLRLVQSFRSPSSSQSEQDPGEIVAALQRQPKSVANRDTGIVMRDSYAQARAAGGLGDRPLIVLTAGRPPSFGNPEMDRQAVSYHQVWIRDLQAQLAKLSSRGRQVVVQNSDHAIADREPDAVIAAIREVVTEVREKSPGR